MRRVKHFFDILAAVVEGTVAQDESQPTVGKIGLVRLGKTAGNKGHSGAIEAAMPVGAERIDADLEAIVVFGVAKRFVLAFIPSPASENVGIFNELLFEVETKPVLNRSLLGRCTDIRSRSYVLQIKLHRLFI